MKTFNFTILLLLFISASSKAQFLQDIQGRVINEQSYTDIIGTPFFNNEFLIGKVVLTNGDKFENLSLKYNIYNDELFFRNNKDGSLLSFVIPVKSFEILDQKYENGFPSVDNFSNLSYYVVIANSKVKLLLKHYKVIIESKPYNAVNLEKKFEDSKLYYFFRDNKMQRFKPSKKEVLEIFNDKNPKIDAFLKTQKIDLRNDLDLARVFEYYGTLQ